MYIYTEFLKVATKAPICSNELNLRQLRLLHLLLSFIKKKILHIDDLLLLELLLIVKYSP